jgi:ketosteroid isomerase-like protein
MPLLALIALLMAAPASPAPAPDAAALTALLSEFLAGASRGDAAVHDRFWADDLVYTRSAGRRIGKAEVLRDARARPSPRPNDPSTVYSSEDVRIQQFGDTAVVAFRLVGTTGTGATARVTRYLNTGTFRRRDGRWQAVAWQSTRVPRPEEDARKEVAAAEDAFRRAVLARDVQALEALTDADCLWVTGTGEKGSRADLLDAVRAGNVKVPAAPADATVVVHGDGAVAVASAYTLTLADEGDGWKAVVVQLSRPPQN